MAENRKNVMTSCNVTKDDVTEVCVKNAIPSTCTKPMGNFSNTLSVS